MMKTLFTKLFLALVLCAPTVATAQQVIDVDRSKYPDYTETVNPDWSLMPQKQAVGTASRDRTVSGRPDHVNNAETRYFPPVFSQAGGSCGSASRICYMFSYELAAYRDVDGSKSENYYPSHFVWLHTNSPGNQGKDAFVMHVGVPSAATYGGQTYSELFGYQEETYNDFGWMQGYDKWFEAMHNRMLQPSNFPVNVGTPEGREAVKNWLWNHNGDNSFAAGGICGIGVASGGVWKDIPKTPTNDAIGVSGMGYVHQWGTQVDHALTIVGYDDRIEFDLDKDGKYGEPEADELGAWIIVNSWGMWENKGFIYCPYAHGVPAFNSNGTIPNNFWTPEIYRVRKDYRPLRTIKLEMDYSRRSEIALSAGISADLNATKPEKTVSFVHFTYAGDGNYGNSNPAPEVPMLGRWADGKLHTEPMEFGYDLTDLTDGYDMNAPLKYFFIVDTKSWAQGKGTIHKASIMDYQYDLQGLEIPFGVGDGVEIQNAGDQTIISVIVHGSSYHAPQNVAFNNGSLVWEAPKNSSLPVASYCIYHNGLLVGNVPASTCVFTPKTLAAGEYAVSALYADDNESSKVSVQTPVVASETNMGVKFDLGGFTIPGVFGTKYTQATIEYWIKPTTLTNWNQSGGPGWNTFMFHANSGGAFTAGWDTSNRLNTSASLKTGKWNHVAIVVDGNKMTVYLDGVNRGSVTSQTYNGIGGFGDLVFSANGATNAQNGVYDEIRIWNTARTAAEIKASKDAEFVGGGIMPKGLIAYLKGDVITDAEGNLVMFDYVGGHHAKLQGTYTEVNTDMPTLGTPNEDPVVSIDTPKGSVYAGVPVVLTATYNTAVTHLEWTSETAGLDRLAIASPTVTFATAGTHTVSVTATSNDGRTATATYDITVEAAPAIDATFTMTTRSVPAGERVTFLPTNPMSGCHYLWEMPGAEEETSTAINTATSYTLQGSYTVTLTVTAPDGTQKSHSEQLEVLEVAPKAAFEITPAVVVKGETLNLIDKSLYSPTAWEWYVSNGSANYLAYDQHKTFAIDKPGIYSVKLTATNGSGATSTTRERAIIVTNADSKNGLVFNYDAAAVTASKHPLTAGQKTFSIDWWMNCGFPEGDSNGLGESEGTMIVKTLNNGKLALYINGKSVMTADNFVIPGEWHHYAITFNQGKVMFYRDGWLRLTRPMSATTALSTVNTFRIGGSQAPFNGSIDELRVWGKVLTEEEMKVYSNAPIEDVAQAEAEDQLLLYYNFNQSGGNVQDATSNANHGVRSNFGPDGDAWALSKGVFCLNFEEGVSTDVTAEYLTNYAKAFEKSNTCVNPNLSTRTFALQGWTIENAVTEGNITTGAHVDAGKLSCFTVTTKWDGFAAKLNDHKVYQTVTLPAGRYTFEAMYDDTYEGQCGESYIVAAEGNTLPVTAALDEALAYTAMRAKGNVTTNKVAFTLSKETTVSLGLLINITGESCMTIQRFSLKKDNIVIYSKSSDIVASIAQLSNTQLYYVSQPYHTKGITAWAVAEGGKALKTTGDLSLTTDKADTRQQFAFISNDNGATHYLYHAAEKKFVNKDGSLADVPTDAIHFIAGAYDTTFVAYFDETHYINVGGSKEMVVNDWSTPDGGNSCAIYPAGTFSPKKALAQFPAVKADGITLSQSSITIEEGGTLTLTATVTPDYATDKRVAWSSSDADVAVVVKGVVVGLSIGTATITAQSGDQVATCEVTVVKKTIPVRSIILEQSSASLIEGDTLTLSVIVNPDNADDKTVTWETSDAAVAIVDNGVVIAVAPGTATITAEAGGKTATCVVTVEKRYVPIAEVILSQTELVLEVGETHTLTVTILPENATDQDVVWSTSSRKVASVRKGVVTAAGAGTATISARVGDITVTCTVTVNVPDGIEQVTNDDAAVIYDLTGRRVEKASKGIYIVNGKKVVLK